MKPQKINLKISGCTYSDFFANDEHFHLLFSKNLLEIGLYKPEWGFNTTFKPITSIEKGVEEKWHDSQDFQKDILTLIKSTIPCLGSEPKLKDIEVMKNYWEQYGPLYILDDIENKTEIIKHFIGTCYSIALILCLWNPKLFKTEIPFDNLETVEQILVSTSNLTNPSQETGQYYTYLSIWNDKNQFAPTWKSFVRIPWIKLIEYEDGFNQVLSHISTDIKDEFLRLAAIMDEERWHSPRECKQFYEFLTSAENKHWDSFFTEFENLQQSQTFFPIIILSNNIELNKFATYVSKSDCDNYIAFLKTAYLNAISATLAFHPARIVTSINNNKISFTPQLDNNIIYFLTAMIEKLSVADYCQECGKELQDNNKTSGKRKHFCNNNCYDRFRYHNDETRKSTKNISDYICNTLRNRQGKDNIDISLKKKLLKEANKLLNENQTYDDVRKSVKKMLDEKCPIIK